MRINRYKNVKRTLNFYSRHFGFRKPYQVLIDGTMCQAALKNQVDIRKQFTIYLGGDVKLLTTQCLVSELEELGSTGHGASLIIKQFGMHKCHHMVPILAAHCMLHMIGIKNESRYIVASQDRNLQERCRRIPGVPLLYLSTKTPILEPPSAASEKAISSKFMSNYYVDESEKNKIKELTQNEEENLRRRRKRKKGPNPLSCKKKKKKTDDNSKPTNSNPNPKKKKRKKNRSILVKKIKKEIMASNIS